MTSFASVLTALTISSSCFSAKLSRDTGRLRGTSGANSRSMVNDRSCGLLLSTPKRLLSRPSVRFSATVSWFTMFNS